MSNPGETDHERGYIEGRRRTSINLLKHYLSELAGEDLDESDAVFVRLARLLSEREEAIAAARMICREFGLPQDWPDDLHLSDVIEKRVVRELKR